MGAGDVVNGVEDAHADGTEHRTPGPLDCPTCVRLAWRARGLRSLQQAEGATRRISRRPRKQYDFLVEVYYRLRPLGMHPDVDDAFNAALDRIWALMSDDDREVAEIHFLRGTNL